MKKFINEYKALRQVRSETGSKRERVTVTTSHISEIEEVTTEEELTRNTTHVGTLRTEEYKRDLAEFQARRLTPKELPNGDFQTRRHTPKVSDTNQEALRGQSLNELPDTPVKSLCGRRSLPSCVCANENDVTFNQDEKSASKYKKKTHKRTKSENETKVVPNVQFMFKNQVFMPGNYYAPFSEPTKSRRHSNRYSKSPERLSQKRLIFDSNEDSDGPLFYKNNSLPVDIKNFLKCSKNGGVEEVDGLNGGGDSNLTSRSSSDQVGNDSDDKLWEVMSELKNLDNWADEQLKEKSLSTTRSDDNKSETSAFGLPIASVRNLDIEVDRDRIWNKGKWGAVPVKIKKMNGVTLDMKKDCCMEITILRKCRHPNILLLMGLYPDVQGTVHIICENFTDTLYGILHVKGLILSVQTSVNYALDIANALVFLRMQGYIHTELTSASVVITGHDAAKLADFTPCVKLPKPTKTSGKVYDMYSKEPQYVNIDDTHQSNGLEYEPLISQRSSEAYIRSNAVTKPYKSYSDSEFYFWHAPELFMPDELGLVHPCSKSDVYSLCVVLWECCNASLPWISHSYEKLKEQYTLWKVGMILPQDGTYPGCLLALLQEGLRLERSERIELATLQETLHTVKRNVDELEYIVIPARLSKKKSAFSTNTWDITSPTDSDCPNSDQNTQKPAINKNTQETTSESEKEYSDNSKIHSPPYESIQKDSCNFTMQEKCNNSVYEGSFLLKYEYLPERDFSSACSTPIAKLKARIKDIGTPNALHRSDSTEYCSILSPKTRFDDDFSRSKDGSSIERSSAKLSRSFTPKSYRPLHIKVPEFNLEEMKSLPKDESSNRSSYNFDIKNYSLPSTPIARSNKLRKNAWLSGELNSQPSSKGILKFNVNKTQDVSEKIQSAPEIQNGGGTSVTSIDKEQSLGAGSSKEYRAVQKTPESDDDVRDCFTGLKRIFPSQDFSSPESAEPRCATYSSSNKSSQERAERFQGDVLASVSVKPLVAIHERWIYEANRTTARAMSLPDSARNQVAGVKPASHCVDPLPKSMPQLNTGKKSILLKPLRRSVSPNLGINGNHWEQFCQARDTIAKTINMAAQHADRGIAGTWKKERGKWTSTDDIHRSNTKIDQATDTTSIEEYIKEMIRKEVQRIIHDISDDMSTSSVFKSDEIINKGVANIMENVKNCEDTEVKKEPVKSFSRVKINGNNKPLLQIVFNRSGENSLQVLDNCVNVTICDNNAGGKEKVNLSLEDTLTEDFQAASLKRCQGFNALQEARSTEDLYIDDDLSTQMQENFGGKVKLIPLHGSLHEILCEKEDECCLIKVKQENGCDTIYFKCDNSDTESKDAIDGSPYDNPSQDTVVFKRSISLIEERIQRIVPKKSKPKMVSKVQTVKVRPKSEVNMQNIDRIDRNVKILSNSSPCLTSKDSVEVNIENTMNYEDSSSDESIKCHENDDFELLERKIEEDIASLSNCGYLEKISEENLAYIDEGADKVVEK